MPNEDHRIRALLQGSEELQRELEAQEAQIEEAMRWLGMTEADLALFEIPPELEAHLDALGAERRARRAAPPPTPFAAHVVRC